MTARPRVVWCLGDGKAGHENQTGGLLQALEQITPVTPVRLTISSPILTALRIRRLGANQPRPDLILAAGHRTHWAALAARRAFGGRVVLMMKPTLPVRWFDLCFIPEHDAPPAAPNIVATRGVLNNIQPGTPRPDCGLFLIGGPSTHHDWSDRATTAQVAHIAQQEPDVRWQLTTSRRTPASFLPLLTPGHVTVTPVSQTGPGWVRRELATASRVWVTEDSVSMVYEALTAGSAVGILPVPRRRPSRVTAGLDGLLRDGWVTGYADWQQHHRLPAPPHRLAEANRCAALVAARFGFRT